MGVTFEKSLQARTRRQGEAETMFKLQFYTPWVYYMELRADLGEFKPTRTMQQRGAQIVLFFSSQIVLFFFKKISQGSFVVLVYSTLSSELTYWEILPARTRWQRWA